MWNWKTESQKKNMNTPHTQQVKAACLYFGEIITVVLQSAEHEHRPQRHFCGSFISYFFFFCYPWNSLQLTWNQTDQFLFSVKEDFWQPEYYFSFRGKARFSFFPHLLVLLIFFSIFLNSMSQFLSLKVSPLPPFLSLNGALTWHGYEGFGSIWKAYQWWGKLKIKCCRVKKARSKKYRKKALSPGVMRMTSPGDSWSEVRWRSGGCWNSTLWLAEARGSPGRGVWEVWKTRGFYWLIFHSRTDECQLLLTALEIKRML